MTKPIRVTAIYNQDAPIRLYVLALIALARQLQEEEEEARTKQPERQQHGAEGGAADD